MSPPIRVRYTKWDGALHWHFPMRRLAADAHGTWLGASAGTPVRRGDQMPILSPAFVLLVPGHAHWTAVWNDPVVATPFPYRIYADVCSPAQWSDHGVTMIDLDLDVVLTLDGAVERRDGEEFVVNARRWHYPAATRRAAQAAADHLVVAMREQEPPFDDSALVHLEQARRLRPVDGSR